MAFDVHVVGSNEHGVGGIRVMLEFTSILRGVTDWVYTDSDGHAEFEGYEDGEIIVYVDGDNCGTYRYEDGDSITISI